MKLKSFMFSQTTTTMFFYPNVLDRNWWFILKRDLRSKHIFENKHVIIPRKNIIKVMEMKSDMYMFYFNIYIVDVSYYYGYL